MREAPFIVTCQGMQAGDLSALVEVPPFLLCYGTHALALHGPLTCYYCSVGLVRSDCKVLGCKSQAAAICCLSASLSLFSTSQLVERYVCQLAVHAAGGGGLAQG